MTLHRYENAIRVLGIDENRCDLLRIRRPKWVQVSRRPLIYKTPLRLQDRAAANPRRCQ